MTLEELLKMTLEELKRKTWTARISISIIFSNGKLGRLKFHDNFVAFVAERLTRSTLNCSEEEEAAIIFKLVFCLGPYKYVG